MTKYLFVYRSQPNPEMANASPEEMQQMLAQWASWKEKFKAQVIDMGDGLQETGKVLKDGEVTDGPFAEAKEVVGGYSVVEADDYDTVLEVARGCPMTLVPGGSIEIRPLMEY